MNVIEVHQVSKRFRRQSASRLLREHFKERLVSKNSHQYFYALRDVSFAVKGGEGVQIVGGNGAGKSTLLGLITGLTPPDEGTVWVEGRVGALLELGSGFHPDLTGLENLGLNAALIGIDEPLLEELTPKIIAFAELADYINEPLRTYSAGMVMRLAFSVAISLEPDVLIVDEVLGVGDSGFQIKCYKALQALRNKGMTLLCVSHGAGPAAEMCSRAIWLHEGKLILDDDYATTMRLYQRYMESPDKSATPQDLISRNMA